MKDLAIETHKVLPAGGITCAIEGDSMRAKSKTRSGSFAL